jgi:hypothetical protein
MQGHQGKADRLIAVNNFSWSYFISKHLLTKYKFIPTHLSTKDTSSYQKPRNHKLIYSLSLIIM